MASEQNLLKVIDSIGYEPSKKVQAAEAKRKATREAYEAFLEKNPQLARLEKAKDDSYRAYDRLNEQERKEFQAARRAVRNAVLLSGATPEVVRKVKAFAAKYQR